jgi:PAS domain S-box-containing protein
MQGILGGSDLVGNKIIHLEVFDGEKASPETLLYDSQSAGGNELAPASALALQTSVDSAGRRWTLCFTQSGSLAAGVDYSKFWLVLFGGTSVSLLLFGLSLSLLNTRFNAWKMATKLTAEYKRAEESLRESEERHRVLFDQSRDAMMTLAAPSWRFTSGNPAALALFGVKTADEFLALGPWDVSPERQPDGSPSAEKAREMIETALREGSHFFEWTHKRTDGEPILCTVLCNRISVAGKVFVQATVRDITEQKQAEAIQQEALDRLQKIASRVPGLVYQYRLRPDGSACLPFASEAIREIFRVSPEEVREDASNLFANLHPDDYDGIFASIQKSARDLTPWQHEFRVKYDDGTIRALYGNAAPQREKDGSVLWHGFITDITERKRAETALRESEELLSEMTTQVPGVVYQFYARPKNGEMGFYYVSDRSERILGLKPDVEGYLDCLSEDLPSIFSEFPSRLVGLTRCGR